MKEFAAMFIAQLGITPAEIQLRCKDVVAALTDGSKRTIRVELPARGLMQEVFLRYAATNEPRILVQATVPAEVATDDFLNRISPLSLSVLALTAIALHFGPDGAAELAQAGHDRMRNSPAEVPITG